MARWSATAFAVFLILVAATVVLALYVLMGGWESTILVQCGAGSSTLPDGTTVCTGLPTPS